jgi:PPOX class probable F420-dependent enzyme
MSRCEENVNRVRARVRKDRPFLSADARTFADGHRVAHLATADAAGVPHVIPICYALVGEDFYFVVDDKPKRTRTGLKRLRNIAANPRVALVIDDYDEDWTRLAYVLVHGQAAVVDDRHEYAGALSVLRARYPQYRSMPLGFDTHPMVRITPGRVHLWRPATES